MRSTVYPADAGTTVPEAVVVVNGDPVNATSVSMTSEIPSHLPAQVSGSGGISATTGTVEVEIGAGAVSNQVPTPWTGTTPSPGDTVAIDVGRDGVQSRVLTGIVDDASGSASGGVLSFGVTDEIRRLDNPVSIPPLCKIMPAPTTDGSTNARNCDLIPTYFVDKVLRECGFYATPRRVSYCVMSAPLMGSTWPEVGTLLTSGREGSHKLSPYWGISSWGVLANSVTATYAPDYQQWADVPGTLTRPMEIVVCAGNQQSASGRVNVEWANDSKYSLVVTSSRSVLVQVQFASSSEWQTILSATTATLGGWRTATARLTPLEGRQLRVEIRTNNGGYAKHFGSTIPYRCTVDPINEVRLQWSENQLGGVQVGFPSTSQAFSAANHKMTATLTPPPGFYSLTGSPAIDNVPAIELLKEWSEAECAAMWLDEDGAFQWRNRDRFIAGEVAWEGDSLNDLFDYEWSHTADGARSDVVVEHADVGVQRSKRSRIQVWQGNGQTMDPGDVQEEIVSVPDDEAWIGLDTTLDVFQAETLKRAFNKGLGSWGGYVAYDANDDRHGNTEYVGYTAEVSNVGIAAYKITQLWDGHVPSGVSYIKLATQDDSSVLKPQWQGFNLPVLRAQCRLRFADATSKARVSMAPTWAPSLRHETGWWVQGEGPARALAYWLAQQTVKPRPVVEGIRLRPDARLQMGDKIRVSDRHRTGTTITGVVIHRQHGLTHAQHEMTLSLLVTGITTMEPTLQEYDQAWSGATLEDRDATWVNQSLAQFDADPLRR
jgi:hypothetical protein